MKLLHHPFSLWAKVLKAKYFPTSSFWDARSKRRQSWIWASFLAGREVLRRGVRMNIGDGASTHIWSNPWVSHLLHFLEPRPTLYLPNIDLVADSINHLALDWDYHLLFNIFSRSLTPTISSIPIAPSRTIDTLVWHYMKDGQYIRSGYRFMIASSLANTPTPTMLPSLLLTHLTGEVFGLRRLCLSLSFLSGDGYIMPYRLCLIWLIVGVAILLYALFVTQPLRCWTYVVFWSICSSYLVFQSLYI